MFISFGWQEVLWYKGHNWSKFTSTENCRKKKIEATQKMDTKKKTVRQGWKETVQEEGGHVIKHHSTSKSGWKKKKKKEGRIDHQKRAVKSS